nr:hypothetical protein [Tanacetum cinerariifolium]
DVEMMVSVVVEWSWWQWRGGGGSVWQQGVAVVVVLEAVVARGGEWCGGSSRSEWREHFCGFPESSSEKFFDDGERGRW